MMMMMMSFRTFLCQDNDESLYNSSPQAIFYTDRIVREVESAKKRILCDYSTQTEKEQAFPAVEMLAGRLCVYVDQREKNTDAAACSSLMP